jgi:hypothetical protein
MRPADEDQTPDFYADTGQYKTSLCGRRFEERDGRQSNDPTHQE